MLLNHKDNITEFPVNTKNSKTKLDLILCK